MTNKPKAVKKVAPKPKGKPTAYTKERADAVIELLERGVWVTEACRQVGIPIGTWCGWVEADRDGLSDRSARAHNS